MEKIKVRLTFLEEVLGGMPNNEELYAEYVAGKAPDLDTVGEEVEEFNVSEEIDKGTTVFQRDPEGRPCLYNYHIKGFFKSACGSLARDKKSKSAKIKAYKKIIDGNVFVKPRYIPFENCQGITYCERPLRASTPQGERVALARSEAVNAGSQVEFTIFYNMPEMKAVILEWLDYGEWRGIGQWRNSDKGSFTYEILEE